MLEFTEENHEYRIDGQVVHSVTQCTDLLSGDYFRKIDSEILERKAALGTLVHNAAATFNAEGDICLDNYPDAAVPYIEAYLKFRREADWQVAGFEQKMGSKIYRYAGAADEWGLLNGEPAILDTKTTVQAYPWTGVQLAGYKELIIENEGGKWKEAKRFALQLKANGKYSLIPYTKPIDWGVFFSCLNIKNWRSIHSA